VRTWLFRIAANKARDFREKQIAAKRGGGVAPASLDEEDPRPGLRLAPPSERPGPDGELLSAEAMAEVRRALDELGDPCRELLELRYFCDLDYAALGAALGLDRGKV